MSFVISCCTNTGPPSCFQIKNPPIHTDTHMHSGTGTWSYWEVSVLDPTAGLNGEYEGIYSWQNASANPPHRPAAYTRSWMLPTLQTLRSTPLWLTAGPHHLCLHLAANPNHHRPAPSMCHYRNPTRLGIRLFWKVLHWSGASIGSCCCH